MTEPIRFTTQQPQGRELVPFVIDGVGLITNEPWEELFHALPVVPAGAVDSLTLSLAVDDKGRQTYSKMSVLNFFDQVLVDEDVARFRAMCADKDKAVDIDTLGAIMQRLSGEVTGVPTKPLSASGNGAGRGAST